MSWALLSDGYPTQRTSIPMSQCPWFSSFQCFLRWAAVFPEVKQRGLPNDQAGPGSWLGAVSRLRAAVKCVIHSWEEAASSSCRGRVGTGREGSVCSVPLCAFCAGSVARTLTPHFSPPVPVSVWSCSTGQNSQQAPSFCP